MISRLALGGIQRLRYIYYTYQSSDHLSILPLIISLKLTMENMEVTMDIETIVLIASLVSFAITTSLSIAIVALCFAYCKVCELKFSLI